MTWQSHTTGPWEATPPAARGGTWTIRVAGAPASAGAIAKIPFTENKPVEANARLMAAAPTLFSIVEAYLQELLNDYREFTGIADDLPEVGEVLIIDECLAVIEKVKGCGVKA